MNAIEYFSDWFSVSGQVNDDCPRKAILITVKYADESQNCQLEIVMIESSVRSKL